MDKGELKEAMAAFTQAEGHGIMDTVLLHVNKACLYVKQQMLQVCHAQALHLSPLLPSSHPPPPPPPSSSCAALLAPPSLPQQDECTQGRGRGGVQPNI